MPYFFDRPTAADPQKETTHNPHGSLNLPCENCHTSAAWRPIRAVPEFDHGKTSYPLQGMHEKVKCVSCHLKPVFTNVGKNCADCHADIHRRQMGPNCAQCHTVQGWNVAVQPVKDHQNRFPLLGTHAAVQCNQCHKQLAAGVFYGLSTQCDSCHLKDWQSTTNPPHATAGPAFASGNCRSCHTFDSFLTAKFDHSATGFPLTAGHANVPCASCHVNNNYNLQIAPTDCGNAGCHLTTWQQTNNPSHASAGPAFAAANCSQCHNTTSWTTETFDHASTGFPLTNAHATVPCSSCHINNNYALTTTPNDCGNAGCHLTTWQQTNNPPHPAAGSAFAVANCSTCHDTIAWTDVTSFNHANTGFALTGAHTTTSCVLCHVNNNYNLTAANTDCYGCHTSDWNSTATMGGAVPNHVAAQLPTSLCSSCHDTISWSDGKFDHSTTGWALTGGHIVPTAGGVQSCADCHVNNNYSLTAANTTCYGCHTADWNSTQTLGGAVPNHIAAGFLTTCDSCHTTSNWLGATFNHSNYFPIPHHESNSPPCNDCHQVSTDYSSFSCIGCHTTTAHQQKETVNAHNGVKNFVYGPETCYNCHKNGGAG